MQYKLNSGNEFPAHAEGQHQGTIVEFIDRGLVEDTYNGETKTRHKAIISILSKTATNDDGSFCKLDLFVTLSGAPNSTLTMIREALAGKKFSRQALEAFDSDDLVGLDVEYQVVQYEGVAGNTRSKLGLLPNGQLAIRAIGPNSGVAVGMDPQQQPVPIPEDDGLPF